MLSVIAALPKFQFFNANGTPLVGGTLSSFLAGGTTPAITYQDAALTIANEPVIELDSRGECLLWLDLDTVYKFTLKNAAGATLWTVDGVTNPTALLRSDLSSSGGASIVGYLPTGAGAVATTVQDELRQVKRFVNFLPDGYVTDGTVDYTASLVLACNACTDSGFDLDISGG